MRRLLFCLIIVVFSSTSVFADELNVQSIQNMAQTAAESAFEPVLDLFSAGFNSGIFAPVSGSFISLGIQANLVSVKKDGLLSGSSISMVPIPFAYAGIRIPGFGINLFIRGMVFPADDQTMKIAGFGGGWEPSLIPLFSIKMIIQYHMLKGFPFIEGSSIGGTILASLSLVPMVTPFALLGLNNTTLKTPGLRIPGAATDFSMDKTGFQAGLGVKILKIFTLEADVFPAMTYSLSLGFSI